MEDFRKQKVSVSVGQADLSRMVLLGRSTVFALILRYVSNVPSVKHVGIVSSI